METISEKEKSFCVKLKGTLDIYQALEHHRTLMEVVDTTHELILDFGQVEHCDLAGVQLIISAHKTLNTGNRTFKMQNIPQLVLQTMHQAGIAPEAIFNSDKEI